MANRRSRLSPKEPPRLRIKGLIVRNLPSGNTTYAVRVEGDANKRIAIPFGPDDPRFLRHYVDARAGIKPKIGPLEILNDNGNVLKEIGVAIAKARTRAANRGHDFDITDDFVFGLLERQEGRCAMSGIEFDLRPDSVARRRPFAFSIDRVDSSKGYTKTNVRLVCTMVNIAISDWNDESFIRMCKAVSEVQSVPREKTVGQKG